MSDHGEECYTHGTRGDIGKRTRRGRLHSPRHRGFCIAFCSEKMKYLNDNNKQKKNRKAFWTKKIGRANMD